eukprot:4023229-Amphidinium_carterae.2
MLVEPLRIAWRRNSCLTLVLTVVALDPQFSSCVAAPADNPRLATRSVSGVLMWGKAKGRGLVEIDGNVLLIFLSLARQLTHILQSQQPLLCAMGHAGSSSCVGPEQHTARSLCCKNVCPRPIATYAARMCDGFI